MSKQKLTDAPRRLRDLPRAVIAAFVCCFLAGYIAHLFAYTNIVPNADGISRVADPQQMTISGRWFLHYATAWNGFVQAPAVIGFFSVLFLSLAAALTVSLLKIRSAVIGGLIGAVMIVFPTIAYTNLYLFTASAYCFGILLAVLSVWVTTRYRLGFLAGMALLACAVGTYQAYLAVAVSLSLIWLLLYGLEEDRKAGELVRAGLKMLLYLILGLALYFLILKLFLWIKDLKLLSYKGIGSFGESLTLGTLLTNIGSAYEKCIQYFFIPRSFSTYTTPAAVVCNAALALAGLWAFVLVIRRNRCLKRPGTFMLLLVLCGLLPLGLNLTVLMGEAMPIMRYALVFAYVLVLALVDQAAGGEQSATGEKKSGKRNRTVGAYLPILRRLLALCGALGLLLVSFQTDNTVYTMSATAHRATESFATRLVERVESTPGYVNGMEVVIIGGFPRSVYHNDIETFGLLEDYSNLSSTVIPLNKQVYYYLNDWLNVPWQEPEEDTLIRVAASQGFQQMPLYPSDGSIVISGDRVIVKLASRYTPKKDYEIEYENRR